MPPQEMKDLLDMWCMECSSSSKGEESDGIGSKNNKNNSITWKSVDPTFENAMSHAKTSIDPVLSIHGMHPFVMHWKEWD